MSVQRAILDDWPSHGCAKETDLREAAHRCILGVVCAFWRDCYVWKFKRDLGSFRLLHKQYVTTATRNAFECTDLCLSRLSDNTLEKAFDDYVESLASVRHPRKARKAAPPDMHECCVCLEHAATAFECDHGHWLCTVCLSTHLLRQSTCPVCRVELDPLLGWHHAPAIEDDEDTDFEQEIFIQPVASGRRLPADDGHTSEERAAIRAEMRSRLADETRTELPPFTPVAPRQFYSTGDPPRRPAQGGPRLRARTRPPSPESSPHTSIDEPTDDDDDDAASAARRLSMPLPTTSEASTEIDGDAETIVAQPLSLIQYINALPDTTVDAFMRIAMGNETFEDGEHYDEVLPHLPPPPEGYSDWRRYLHERGAYIRERIQQDRAINHDDPLHHLRFRLHEWANFESLLITLLSQHPSTNGFVNARTGRPIQPRSPPAPQPPTAFNDTPLEDCPF